VSVQLPETPKFLIEERSKKVTRRVTPTPVAKIPVTSTLLHEQLAKFDEEARIEEEFATKNRERAERKKAELAMRSLAAVETLRAVKAAEENAKIEAAKLEAAKIEAAAKEELKRQEEDKARQAAIEAGLSWRELLTGHQDQLQNQLQRDWGLLCERARGLAPETNWFFLFMGTNNDATPAVVKWRNWLERFICSYDWHSPREVEVVFNIERGLPVFTISWKKSELPPPLFVSLMDWTILPVTVNECVGFKMTYTGTFISDKAGLA
jgi:hypothetical protein